MPGLGPGIHELRRKMVTRSRGVRGVALFSAMEPAPAKAGAPPRDQLVDAKPKAWHDERGADGARPLLQAPKPNAYGAKPWHDDRVCNRHLDSASWRPEPNGCARRVG